MPHCLYAWQHREQMFAVGHFPILTNSLTLQIFCNIDLYTHINISSMNASSFVYIDVVIICTMMSFYQQILHSFSCYKVLCIANLTYAGHFAVSPSSCQKTTGFLPDTWQNAGKYSRVIHLDIIDLSSGNQSPGSWLLKKKIWLIFFEK